MKIAIDARPINHNFRQGIFNYTERLIYGLARIDKENDFLLLFTSLRKKYHQMPGPIQENFFKKVLPVPDRGFFLRKFFLYQVVLPYFLKKNNCAVYHAPAGYTLPNINGKIKKILTIHDLRSLKITDKTFPQDISSLKKAANDADVCITISECTKKDIVENLRVAPEKIKVIYEGADEIFKPIEHSVIDDIKQKYQINKNYFFSLGQVPRKNIERLIKAFSIFKYKSEFLLVIGGAGNNGPWMIKYRDLAKKLNIDESVKFIGYIPYEDLPLLYNGSECFVFPSLYEGFGIPLLEAMSCGRPVITSNVSSLPEIGKDAVLYVDPYNENDIASKMEKLVEDRELRGALIKKGISRAQEFSWMKMAQETLKIYMD